MYTYTNDSIVGKTYIIHQLAEKYKAQVHAAQLGTLASKYHGRLSKGFKRIMWNAKTQPSVIVLDDIDLFFPRDETPDMALLDMLKELTHDNKTMIVATTRRADAITSNIRILFQDEIHLQLPTPDERYSMLQYIYQTCFTNHVLNESDIRSLSSMAHAFIAADLAQWCRLAEEDAIINNKDHGKFEYS